MFSACGNPHIEIYRVKKFSHSRKLRAPLLVKPYTGDTLLHPVEALISFRLLLTNCFFWMLITALLRW